MLGLDTNQPTALAGASQELALVVKAERVDDVASVRPDHQRFAVGRDANDGAAPLDLQGHGGRRWGRLNRLRLAGARLGRGLRGALGRGGAGNGDRRPRGRSDSGSSGVDRAVFSRRDGGHLLLRGLVEDKATGPFGPVCDAHD